jgi:Lrp/AsnC family leucine-responsive transcriptional regulator
VELDSTDVSILRVLQEDGRASLREISRRTGVTAPTVSSRVKAMEEIGLIRRYGATVSAEGLGQTTMLVIVKARPSDLKPLAEKLAALTAVRRVFIASGGNLLVEVTLEDTAQMKAFLSKVDSMKEVDAYDTFTATEVVKEEPRAIVREGAFAVLTCFYCGKTIRDEPIKLKLDGRTHYLCCNTCCREYKAKYERIKAGA